MTDDVATGPETIRREGAWASWAPSGRVAVPAIVLLVLAANLVGVATVTMLLIGVDDGSTAGRSRCWSPSRPTWSWPCPWPPWSGSAGSG